MPVDEQTLDRSSPACSTRVDWFVKLGIGWCIQAGVDLPAPAE
jgi:hypothetical protein